MSATKKRGLLVRRGSPPTVSVALLPQSGPGVAEVLVQVQAAALTPTDALLCAETLPPPLGDLVSLPAETPFVPGLFFYGEVLALGTFVEGLAVGEPVLGIIDGATFTDRPTLLSGTGVTNSNGPTNRGISDTMDKNVVDKDKGTAMQAVSEEETAEMHMGSGCYRDRVRVHFSAVLPVRELAASNFHMPSVISHLPPMVSALFCVASHLRLRTAETLMIIVPRIVDVVFLLQRLLLISDAWSGPLYLIVLYGNEPSRGELERHPLLRPLLPQAMQHTGGGELHRTFLDDFVGLSVEDYAKQKFGTNVQPEQSREALGDLIGNVFSWTHGAGIDVILTLDVDLAPPVLEPEPDDAVDVFTTEEQLQRSPPLLRTLIGTLALRGRLITNCKNLEIMPSDAQHLWITEGSISFVNPHSLLLSAAHHGTMLHAMVEVASRIASGGLPVAESEVAQYRLFEQFHHALEASTSHGGSRGGGGNPGPLLVVLVV